MPVADGSQRDAFRMDRGAGRLINVLSDEVRIRISSADTGGAFTVFEGQTRPLSGPPLHVHRDQDESWFIVEGEYRFEVDGQEIHAAAGAIVFAPRGSRHTFQNIGTTPGVVITTVVPGGLDEFFEELENIVPPGSVPDPAMMAPLFEKYSLEPMGPPLAARPVASACGAD